jgi:hypothetical protein
MYLTLGSSPSDRSAVPRSLYLGVTLSANGREARERDEAGHQVYVSTPVQSSFFTRRSASFLRSDYTGQGSHRKERIGLSSTILKCPGDPLKTEAPLPGPNDRHAHERQC